MMALGLIGSATAQNTSSMSQGEDPNEIVVLSSYVDGPYNVERLLVMESTQGNNEFVVRYKINLTKLVSSYDNNSDEIAGLHNFIESIQSDSLKRINSYNIVGCASPDGPAALNKRLAQERADDFKAYLEKECDMDDYECSVTSLPYQWIDTKEALESSSVPSKSEILSIVESSASQSEIQSQIMAHTPAWDYIKSHILPPMRSVEIHVKYNSWKVVESRTLIEEVVPEEPTPTPSAKGDKSGDKRYWDDYINCIIVEIPDPEIDFPDTEVKEKFKMGRDGAKFKERDRYGRGKVKERKSRWWRR